MSDGIAEYTDEILSNLKELTFVPFVPFVRTYIRPFPTDKLPSPLDSFVECLALSTQTPEGMAGLLALGVLATLFQSRFMVKITEDWSEPLCLWPCVVASPGERKSAVISALTKPVYEFEAEQRELDAADIEKNRTERTILEGQLEAAKKAAVKDSSRIELALDLSAQLADFKELHEYRLLADDATSEKLVDLMEKQGGCLTVCSSEGGIFDAMQGRYDRSANFDIYLKAHAGDPVIVDRIGRRSNYIQNPRLTMMLTIQPEVLSGLMNNAAFRGRGLCGRFLYAMCESKIGNRLTSPPPVPQSVKDDYRAFVRKALSNRYEGTLVLSADADALRIEYQDYVEKKLGNEWENMRDWGGKLVGAMVRIAALFHCALCAGDPTQTEISISTMTAAVSMAEFLGDNAAIAYQVMGADIDSEDAKYLWKKIKGVSEISKRDLFKCCQSHFRKAENMEPALKILIDRGYIAEAERKTAGRPSRVLIVNPEAN